MIHSRYCIAVSASFAHSHCPTGGGLGYALTDVEIGLAVKLLDADGQEERHRCVMGARRYLS